MGCASGKNAGPRNIFGTKYGQNLAAVQIAREKRAEEKKRREEAELLQAQMDALNNDDDASTDDDEDDDDYGPSPAAGIWAGSQKLQHESERIADPNGEAETDDEETNEDKTNEDENKHSRPAKKSRVE